MDNNLRLNGIKGEYSIENADKRTTDAEVGDSKPPKSTRSRLMSETEHWLRDFSELSTIHGMKWYLSAPNVLCKIFSTLFLSTIIIAIPVYFGFRLNDFIHNVQVSTAIEWKRADTLAYPNITVCFAKFFDKRLMEAEGISYNLSNYMTMALDPNAANHVQYIKKYDPNFQTMLDSLSDELNRKLEESGLTIVELFKKIAIRCHDFINFCEIHRSFFFSSPNFPNQKKCCDVLFNSDPVFTNAGTCFTTKKSIFEKMPFTYSSVKVWLNSQQAISPEFDILFKGSDSVDRRGVFFALSNQDHPVTKLLQSPLKVTRGNAVLISLEIKEIDQSSLSENFCIKTRNSNSFEEKFNMTYSKLNCQVFSNLQTQIKTNCSLSPYYGVATDPPNQRPCEPRDFLVLQSSNSTDDDDVLPPCLPSCYNTEYVTHVTDGKIDTGAIARYFDVVGADHFGDPEDMVILQLYFQSFEYESHIVYQESLIDFLSKIGGWLGLVMGASVLSFIELGFMFSVLIVRLLRRVTEIQED